MRVNSMRLQSIVNNYIEILSNKDIISVIYDMTNRSDIDACYIFGSFLTDRFTDESDIDIAIIGDIKLEDLLYLELSIEKAIGRSIDLVKIEDLPMYIQLSIISRDKKIVFKENEATLIYLNELEQWYKNEYPFWLKMQNQLGYEI